MRPLPKGVVEDFGAGYGHLRARKLHVGGKLEDGEFGDVKTRESGFKGVLFQAL